MPPSEPFEAFDPRGLTEDLKALDAGAPQVPARVDEEIVRLARAHFQRFRRRRAARRAALWAGAAAAGLLLCLWGIDPLGWRGPERPGALTLLAHDVDGSGAVDILDAFLLARRIERGEETERRWDLSGDGVVDRRDVDLVALEAVRLR